MPTPGLQPINYGKDYNFFKKIIVSNSSFNFDADTHIPFPIEHLSFVNEGTGIIEVSFNGLTVHSELNPNSGTANVTIHNQGISKIWLRLKSGGISTVRIQTNSSVEAASLSSISGGLPIQISPTSASGDAFGRLRTSDPFTIFESKQLFDNRDIVWSTLLTSGGLSTFNSNRASSLLSVTSTIGSSAIRQTIPRFNYQSGKSMLDMSTFVMGTTPPGITKEIGRFDGYNGLFLRNDGYNLYFVVRSNVTGTPTDNSINRSEWNIDKLDGYGISGVTLDITKAQILVIDFEWLGTGRVRFGFNINGGTYYAHQLLNSNNNSSVYMSTPNLPLRCQITNISSTSSSSFEQICNTVLSEGGFDSKGYSFSADRGNTPLASVTLTAPRYPLISLRLDINKIGAVVVPKHISVLCTTSTAKFRWALILNPTIAGSDAASWTSITNSAAQFDVSRTLTNTLTGGTQLTSGYGTEGTATIEIDIETLYTLGVNLSNVSDQLVVALQLMTNGPDSFVAAISWKEFV
jgi:hypothetical protein